nr:radical SAM protein [Pseudomonas sp. TMW22090]
MLVSFRENFSDRGAVIGLFLSNKCNFICAHCCTESSPSKNDILPLAVLEEFLNSVSSSDNVKAFHASGGEPFLHPKHLQKISDYAHEHGKLFGVNTNGYWTNSKLIKKMLAGNELIGLTHLFISYSKWHEKFISIELINEAIDIGISSHKTVEIMIVYESADELERYQAALTSGRKNLIVMSSPIDYIGRASQLQPADRSVQKDMAYSACNEANRPTLLSNGDFIACCNTVSYSAGNNGLQLGSAMIKSGDQLLREYTQSFHFKAIAQLGPQLVSAILKKTPDKHDNASSDKCLSCEKLLNTHEGTDISSGLRGSGIIKLINL